MKRRNADVDKRRRPVKAKKSSDIYHSSLFTCAKFLAAWGLILLADFILEFRFEYLYPLWLLLCSVQDSFKYQGLVFAVFFVCLAVMADVLCYLLVPAQWLFFVASSYVWVQYVWHTERGICLSTVALWLLFIYVEAALRMRDVKSLPFNLDLCRPFAAHCIGYPVVTLGFGAKSYVGYRMRLRMQKEVIKNNEFYADLLRDSLPPELQQRQRAAISNGGHDGLAAAVGGSGSYKRSDSAASGGGDTGAQALKSADGAFHYEDTLDSFDEHTSVSNGSCLSRGDAVRILDDYEESDGSESSNAVRRRNNASAAAAATGDLDEVAAQNLVNDSKSRAAAASSTASTRGGSAGHGASGRAKDGTPKERKRGGAASAAAGAAVAPVAAATTLSNGDAHTKLDVIVRLEGEVKRLKSDLQASRGAELELRSQVSTFAVDDKLQRSELTQLRHDNESLQNKLQNLAASRQTDKQAQAALERRLQDERRAKVAVEAQLAAERKATAAATRKAEEALAAAAKASASAATSRSTPPSSSECTDQCRQRAEKADGDLQRLLRDLKVKDDQLKVKDDQLQAYWQKVADLQSECESAKRRMQQLESSLSAESRHKLELFSAYNECRRLADSQAYMLKQKDDEIGSLRSHIAEALSLVPQSTYSDAPGDGQGLTCQYTTPKLGSPTLRHSSAAASPLALMFAGVGSPTSGLLSSPLNPNAVDYLPNH